MVFTPFVSFAKNLLRDRQLWWILLGYVGLLLWWRFAIPWPHEHAHVVEHGDHVHVHDPDAPWVFPGFWAALPALLHLALRTYGPREDSRHLLSFSYSEADPRKPFWLAARIASETLLVLLACIGIQSLLLLVLGRGFHVEPQAFDVAAGLALVAVLAWLLVMRAVALAPARLLLFVLLCGLPAIWTGPARPELASCLAFSLVYFGLLLMPPLGRKHALRDLG